MMRYEAGMFASKRIVDTYTIVARVVHVASRFEHGRVRKEYFSEWNSNPTAVCMIASNAFELLFEHCSLCSAC